MHKDIVTTTLKLYIICVVAKIAPITDDTKRFSFFTFLCNILAEKNKDKKSIQKLIRNKISAYTTKYNTSFRNNYSRAKIRKRSLFASEFNV